MCEPIPKVACVAGHEQSSEVEAKVNSDRFLGFRKLKQHVYVVLVLNESVIEF